MTRVRALIAAGVAAATSRAALSTLARSPLAARFERINHRGDVVTMLEGPAFAAGALAGTALAGTATGGSAGRVRAAALIATAGAATFGTIDDLAERTAEDAVAASKGLRGHVGSLLRGRLTTGGAKLVGISAAGIVAAAVALPRRRRGSAAVHAADVVLAGGVIAGAANLVNLLDLRPGRALKAVMIAAAGQAALGHTAVLGAGVGAGAAMLPGDLGERSMLGDSGANAAGALLGVHLVATAPRWVRVTALVAIGCATVASEKVSFTSVIAKTPVLRVLDELGRRPR